MLLETILHNAAHLWVGGSMATATSPNDPVFFLHHANVDRLWARWQDLHPEERFYLPISGGERGINLNDSMPPWGGATTPASVINHRLLGYARQNIERALNRFPSDDRILFYAGVLHEVWASPVNQNVALPKGGKATFGTKESELKLAREFLFQITNPGGISQSIFYLTKNIRPISIAVSKIRFDYRNVRMEFA